MDIWDREDLNEQNTETSKELILSDVQKSIILSRWNDSKKQPPSITELLNIVFPNQQLDGRSKPATLIKEFLVEKGFAAEVFKGSQFKKQFELKPEHKEYIKNNCLNMKAMEMARALFSNNIQPGSIEVKEIVIYLKTLDTRHPDDIKNEETLYSPPKTLDRVVARIRKYVDETRDWDAKKLQPNQRKQAEALMGYLSSFRLKYQIDSYENPTDRELFESTFIKYCFDKPDLTQENCDQYILLCSEIVIISQIQETINMLQREQNRVLEEEGKISMAVVEAIKIARQEHNDCTKRQQALYKSLTQERSDKLSEEVKDKASLLNLINAWKNYETRQQMLKLAGEKKDGLRKELHELESLDEMKMKILGISIDEVLNG